MNLATTSAITSLLTPEFSFSGFLARAVETEAGQKLLVLVASDTLLDRHRTRMTEQAIGMMVERAQDGLAVTPGHDYAFAWTHTTDGASVPFETEVDGQTVRGTAFVVVFPVPDADADPAAHRHLSKLWDEVADGVATHQASIGGFVPVNDPHAVTKVESPTDGVTYDINRIGLNHLAITRGGEASNMRTGFVGATTARDAGEGFLASVMRSVFGDEQAAIPAGHCAPPVTISDGAVAVLQRGGRLADVSDVPIVSYLPKSQETPRETQPPGAEPMSGKILRNWRASHEGTPGTAPAPEMDSTPEIPSEATPTAVTTPADGGATTRSSDAHAERFMTAIEEVLGGDAQVPDEFMRAATAIAELPCDNEGEFKRLAAIQLVLQTRLLSAESIPMERRLLALSVPMGVLNDGIQDILGKLETRATPDNVEAAATEVGDVLLKRIAGLENEVKTLKAEPLTRQAVTTAAPSTPETPPGADGATGGQFAGTLARGLDEWRGRS